MGLISKKVGGYVLGQLILMFSMGLLITIGLTIAKVEFSLMLGAIAGLLDIIPVLGPIIAVSIIILVSLAQKPKFYHSDFISGRFFKIMIFVIWSSIITKPEITASFVYLPNLESDPSEAIKLEHTFKLFLY